MNRTMNFFFLLGIGALAALALMTLTACEPVADSGAKAADASKQVIYDTKRKWSDLFTYKPKNTTPQLPQARYCYQFQTDVVCYDSPQPHMTSKLIGYQDGPNRSWFQPGGGSLGVSGGPVTTTMPATVVEPVPPPPSVVGDACSGDNTQPKPFYCNESPYVRGAVVSKEITAPAR